MKPLKAGWEEKGTDQNTTGNEHGTKDNHLVASVRNQEQAAVFLPIRTRQIKRAKQPPIPPHEHLPPKVNADGTFE